jgi:hypothetical protein
MEKYIIIIVAGLLLLGGIVPVVQQYRARARLHKFFSNDRIDRTKLRQETSFRTARKGTRRNPIIVWNLLDRRERETNAKAGGKEGVDNTRLRLFVGPPKSIWSSKPTLRIHRVVSEVHESETVARKEFEDFLAKYLVVECGFEEPVLTTEVYTESEHQAQIKLLQGEATATYLDAEGVERTLKRHIAPNEKDS